MYPWLIQDMPPLRYDVTADKLSIASGLQVTTSGQTPPPLLSYVLAFGHLALSGIGVGDPTVSVAATTANDTPATTSSFEWSDPSATSASAPEEDRYREVYLAAQFITGLVFYPVVCCFGLAGNVLSVLVLRGRKIRSPTNTFLIALAVSDGLKLVNDLIYFLVILLLHVQPSAGSRAFAYLYPYAHYFFNMTICNTSWLTVSLAAERYILVCHATKAKQLCNVRRAQFVTVAVFVTMSVFAIPFALRYETVYEYDDVSDSIVAGNVKVTALFNNN